jgi:predicted metal-dependent hydrolase
MMRRMFFDWARILLPGFHPWDHDNRMLVARYDSPYADAVPAE